MVSLLNQPQLVLFFTYNISHTYSCQHLKYFICLLASPDDDGASEASSFLQEEIIALKGLELIAEQVEPVQPTPEFQTSSINALFKFRWVRSLILTSTRSFQL